MNRYEEPLVMTVSFEQEDIIRTSAVIEVNGFIIGNDAPTAGRVNYDDVEFWNN